jgi:hypothetical protein
LMYPHKGYKMLQVEECWLETSQKNVFSHIYQGQGYLQTIDEEDL